jgi:hypothetical protein
VPIFPVFERISKVDDQEIPFVVPVEESIGVGQELSREKSPKLKPRILISGPESMSSIKDSEDEGSRRI